MDLSITSYNFYRLVYTKRQGITLLASESFDIGGQWSLERRSSVASDSFTIQNVLMQIEQVKGYADRKRFSNMETVGRHNRSFLFDSNTNQVPSIPSILLSLGLIARVKG